MTEKDLFVGALCDIYGEFLNGKQKRLVSAYFDEDLSLSEIAENEGITRQAVLDSVKRTSAKLYEWEKKCGYCKKILRLKELSDNISCDENSALKEMTDIIDNF